MKRRMLLKSGLAAAAALAAGCFPAHAQSWPAKPIRFIVPYSPGGVSDIAARLVGAKLTEAWGQQVIIENRPGGNGTIGTAAAAKSAPDGYTFVVATVGDFTITQHIVKNLSYDPLVDLVPVTSLTDTPNIVAVSAGSPYKTMKDILDAARKDPGKVGYASPGVGAINQLVMEWIANVSGTSFNHIPYKGGAPSGAAVAAGDVAIGLLSVNSALPHIKSGKIRVIAITSSERSPLVPDVPTLGEQGVGVVDASNYTLMLAPKGTPTEIITKLSGEIAKALNAADIKEKMLAAAAVVIPSSPADLGARLKREAAAFKVIVEKAKITAE